MTPEDEAKTTPASAPTVGRLPALLLDSIPRMDAISFDVFDTLFVRPLHDPEDLFDMLGAKFGIADFRTRRRDAQQRAFATMNAERRHEISLDGIYAELDPLPVPAATLQQAEYDLELALTLPNPEMIGLFRQLVAENRRVVLTSDMYLPGRFFRDLLQQHGLPLVPLFVSSDRNATKRDRGELFALVARDLGVTPDRILHIGDNPVSDILRAREAGLNIYHYLSSRPTRPLTRSSPSASLASAVAKIHERDIVAGTFHELGFHYGGPAAVGLLHWLEQRTKADGIDLLLFTARDCFVLQRLADRYSAGRLPAHAYFMGSRTSLTLATMHEGNFTQHLDVLLGGSHGLSPFELFERIGVPAPADHVLADLGFAPESTVTDAMMPALRQLLMARRWEILKVCRRNRRGLYRYLHALGVRPGMHIGLVDVGWNGTTQEAFAKALDGMVEVDLTGYYFCMTDSPSSLQRRAAMPMHALISSQTVPASLVDSIYANRVMAELFFSAPHHSVIGYDIDQNDAVTFVEDAGRGAVTDMREATREMIAGVEEFAARFHEVCRRADFDPWPLDTVTPFLDLVVSRERDLALIADIENFDSWASTRNATMRVRDYLP